MIWRHTGANPVGKGSIIATSRDPTTRRSGLAANGVKVGALELKDGSDFLESQLAWGGEDLESSALEASAIDELVREFRWASVAAGEIVDERLGRLYANLGSCLLRKGDLEAAEATLAPGPAPLRPKNFAAHCTRRANVDLAQRRIQRAYEVHLEILEIFSKRPQPLSSGGGRLLLQDRLHPLAARFPQC
jgi:hypothetical protein